MSPGVASTLIYYTDESYDDRYFCLSALGLASRTWRDAFELVKEFRKSIKATDGILLRTEIHARDFVRGRGRLGPQMVGKWRRSQIFFELLKLVASLPNAHLFNVCLDKAGRRDPQLDAWNRLLNRINRTCDERRRVESLKRTLLLADVRTNCGDAVANDVTIRLTPYVSRAVILADRGRETEILRLRRKLAVMNEVPSQFGSWDGSTTKNIPLTHLVEDVLFRESAHSYFIQLADCCAYALLKRETPPTPQIRAYGIQKAFDRHLSEILVRVASKDPCGIVRR